MIRDEKYINGSKLRLLGLIIQEMLVVLKIECYDNSIKLDKR